MKIFTFIFLLVGLLKVSAQSTNLYVGQDLSIGSALTTTIYVGGGSSDITNGLLADWRMNETSGTITPDSWVYGFDGTNYGSPILTGSALVFSGSNQYVQIPDIIGLSNVVDGTVICWVTPYTNNTSAQLNNQAYLFSRSGFVNGTRVYLTQTSNYWTVRLGSSSANNFGSVSTNTLMQIAVAYASASFTVYQNGSPILTNSYAGLTSPGSQIIPSSIGGYMDSTPSTNNFFYGSINEVLVYQRKLSSDEILTNWNFGPQ